MARRRGNNEGSLYLRKDGLWCAQVSLAGHRLTKYGKTQRECRGWIKETLARIDNGLTYDGTQITLARFFETWLNGKELSRRPATVNQYRKTAEAHILPIIGKMRLQDIHPTHLKQLYMLKRDEGRGARTVQVIHSILHCALKQAVREGILGRNSADAVERPRVEPAEFQILSEGQARHLLIAAAGSPYETVRIYLSINPNIIFYVSY